MIKSKLFYDNQLKSFNKYEHLIINLKISNCTQMYLSTHTYTPHVFACIDTHIK